VSPSFLALKKSWPQLQFDTKEFVFSDTWWLLLLLATLGRASYRRREMVIHCLECLEDKTWHQTCLISTTIMLVNWRGWYLIVGLILFGTPALVALGPLGVLLGIGAIIAWAMNKYGK